MLVLYYLRAHGLSKGDEHPAPTLQWTMAHFYLNVTVAFPIFFYNPRDNFQQS